MGLVDAVGLFVYPPVPIASQEGRPDGGSVGAQSGRLGRNTPDPHSAERDPRVVDRVEGENHGPAVQQPSGITPERTSVGDQDGEAPHDQAQPERTRGERRRFSNTTIRIDHRQSRTGVGLAGFLGASPLRLISRRGRPNYSLPSRPPWNPSPLSMPNTRSGLMSRSISFPDSCICRTRLPLGTRLKYFAPGLLHWSSSSTNPQAIRRKQNSVRNC